MGGADGRAIVADGVGDGDRDAVRFGIARGRSSVEGLVVGACRCLGADEWVAGAGWS